jgi:hypothetical protein
MLSRRERRNRVDSVPSFEQFLAMRRFPALDGLRGVAAVMVDRLSFRRPKLRLAVRMDRYSDLLRAVGFLITSLALREESPRCGISIRNFWIRRIFRIVPAYLVVLLAMVVITYRRGGPDWTLLKESLPHYLTFTNEFGHPDSPWMLSWTLGIEQKNGGRPRRVATPTRSGDLALGHPRPNARGHGCRSTSSRWPATIPHRRGGPGAPPPGYCPSAAAGSPAADPR